MLRLDVTFVIEWIHKVRINDKVFLVILKTCILSKFLFSVIKNKIGVMSGSVLMYICHTVDTWVSNL